MSNLPSIILISPPSEKNGEIEMLDEFFDAGLQRFHLRKPNFSTDELCKYLEQVSPKNLSKIVIHRAPQLLEQFPLAGYHYTSLHWLLNHIGMKDFTGWAIALNEEVVPYAEIKQKTLGDGDRLILVQATQGG